MKLSYYQALYQKCESERLLWKRRFNQCSLLRVFDALFVLISLLAAIQFRFWAGYILALFGAVIFALLIRWHNRIEEQQQYFEAMQEVAKETISRFDKSWHALEADGAEYFSNAPARAKDLDLFGKASLYQYLCVAGTVYGKDILADWLKNDAPELHNIRQRQQAVAELAQKREFALQLQAYGKQMQHKKAADYRNALEVFRKATAEKTVLSAFHRMLMWALPSITLLFLLASLLKISFALSFSLFSFCFVLQLFFTFLGYTKNDRIVRPVFQFNRSIESYRVLFSRIEQEEFHSPLLQTIRNRMKENGGAAFALERLNKIGEAINTRHNGLAFLLLNGLFLWDFHCANRFIRWRDTYRHELSGWLEMVGETEALMSLSILCNVKEEYTFPKLDASSLPSLSFRGLKHPLLPEQEAVDNDFEQTHRVGIITGSNMSGKTTFLRSIGINLVLAYAGGPVMANNFYASKMKILTSMRIEDSVSERISTFYAELLRIKEMVEESQKKKPLLVLIDEIYKGTNSADRIFGARETIKRLAQTQTATLVTTHDFELCDLEKELSNDAANYHFSETYTDTEILFDYKIKSGRCLTTNAQYLLHMAGII